MKDEYRDSNLGVKVEVVDRRGYDGEQHEYFKVYRRESHRYGSSDGSGPRAVEQYVKVAEFPGKVATEVLFGLAEAYGYKLEGK